MDIFRSVFAGVLNVLSSFLCYSAVQPTFMEGPGDRCVCFAL